MIERLDSSTFLVVYSLDLGDRTAEECFSRMFESSNGGFSFGSVVDRLM